MNIRRVLLAVTLGFFVTAPLHADPADWTLGPFRRPDNAEPVIRPDPDAVFDCPMRQRPVHWEASHTFNPAAVVKDGKIFVLYRAEDDTGAEIGGYTSRLGLASSDDGIHFTRLPAPVLYPADDAQKEHEWEGGCEDPRCVETGDGTFVLFYTQYHRLPDGTRRPNLGMATSRDLVHWTKTGPVVGLYPDGTRAEPVKSASLVCVVRDGRLLAAKIQGKYWLYYGEGTIHLLTSTDLRTWDAVPGFAMPPRPGHFDSLLAECGPPALLTSHGIILIYNGKNATGLGTDPTLGPGAYAAGQALFDAHDPTKLLDRPDQPFFRPELPWEKTGQYVEGTVFTEGLALFHDQWFLYYGCADTFVGVATANVKPGETSAP